MRKLPQRSELPGPLLELLEDQAREISNSANPQTEAERIYKNARKAKWFEPVLNALRTMAGTGERCMFCSGSESSSVEHFRPKSVFPSEAMNWENFLWVCSICNTSKGDRFPPNTEVGESLIDPTRDDVWAFFFIDEFGNLSARWRRDIDDQDPRAVNTIRLLLLDRYALQQSRQMRVEDLKKRAVDSLNLYRYGQVDKEGLRNRVEEWLTQPFQPDVADFFLSGPGRVENPFAELLTEAGI